MTRWLYCILGVVVLLLASCIGIESEIVVRQDGSGILRLSYTVSQFIKNIDEGRADKQLPLPINEEEFRRSAGSIEGLRLTDFEKTEDAENVHIRAELEFDSVQAVNALGREGDIGISFVNQGDTGTFRQVIYAGREEEISAESLEMIETFFEGYELVYSVTVPREVRSRSLGELAPDGVTVTYTVTIPEILESPEPLVLEVTW